MLQGGMSDFATRRILVVDDEATICRLIEVILAPEGGAILQAADGAAALARVAEGGIDLVLLDVRMPGTDGIEVCRRIRELPAGADLPIVLVTGLADGETLARGVEAGADDFLSKPFQPEELVARVRNLLRLRAYREAAELAARRGRLIAEVAGAVAVCRDYDGLLQQLHAALSPSLPFDCAAIFDADGGHLQLKALRGDQTMAGEIPPLAWDERGWDERAREGVVHLVTAHERDEAVAAMLRVLGCAHAAGIPVYGAGALRGLFVFGRRGALSADDLAALGRISPHLANAVDDVRLHVRTEHLLRARAELSQLVVHDLQNPLSAARSHLELALDPEIDDAERPAILRDARRALDRGIALVSDLLDTSAAEEGRLRLDRQPAELREMCREVAEQYGPRHGAAYDIRITGSGPVHASVDHKLMYRVLENIVGNATRYVGQGGRVELSVTRSGDQAVVSVANDGPALAPGVRAWLFQKYAGDPPTGRTGGLGLYFCRLVVEAHGGTIRETAPQVGVRFEISLPAGAASPRRALDLSA